MKSLSGIFGSDSVRYSVSLIVILWRMSVAHASSDTFVEAAGLVPSTISVTQWLPTVAASKTKTNG